MPRLLLALALTLAACGADPTTVASADPAADPRASRAVATDAASPEVAPTDPLGAAADPDGDAATDPSPPAAEPAKTGDAPLDLAEGTALVPPDPAHPAASIDTFWASFQAAVRSGDGDAVLDHFHDFVQADGEPVPRAALAERYLPVLTDPATAAAIGALTPADLDGAGGAHDVRVVARDAAGSESAVVLQIRTLQGYHAISSIAVAG